jgi:hypothetical protein
MLISHLCALLLACVFASPQATQTVDDAALKRSVETLATALRQKDMTALLPLLDANFRTGNFTGAMAQSILRQVIASGRIVPESIRIESVQPEDGNFRVKTTFGLTDSTRPYDLLVTRDGHFIEINLMRLSAASGTDIGAAAGAPGVSLGAAPPAGSSAEVSDPALRAELLQMLQDDQRHRRQITDALTRGDGMESPEMKQLNARQAELDRAALVKLQRILGERGWPTAAAVGADVRVAAFLVLQHAPTEVQEKYLPQARAAAKAGELEGSSLALLEDRVLKGRGQKQRYGTQLETNRETKKLELWPIEDEPNVDARRKAIGLEPLADYLARFKIQYQPRR